MAKVRQSPKSLLEAALFPGNVKKPSKKYTLKKNPYQNPPKGKKRGNTNG
jgi:hypothetical protein